MQKGIAYSTVVIVALLGILLVSIWSYSQLSSGAQYSGTYTSRQSQDISISRLETAKRFLTQNLVFSVQSSSLDIAANGGTQYATTYWYCDSEPTPPETSEVNYALSTGTLNFLNSYVATIPNSELSKIGIQVSNYGCAGIYDPGQINCDQQDSSHCESFSASGMQGGNIQVTTPSPVQYSGSITADATSNRFYWIYYRLYTDTKNSGLLRTIASGLRDSCPTGQNSAGRLDFALSKVCSHYETLLAEPDGTKYVKCQMQILCADTANPVSCVNTPCQRPQAPQSLCWQTASQSPINGAQAVSDFANNLGGSAVSAQGAFASIRVKITLTDTKFNIPSSEGLQPLVWNLWAESQIDNQQCRPIDSGSQ
jgi:hypothetical protein